MPPKEFKFIVGHWYNFTTSNGKYNLYIKIRGVSSRTLYIDRLGYISNCNWEKAECIDISITENPRLLTNLDEIQDFLPDNHPDKIKSILKVEDLIEGEIYTHGSWISKFDYINERDVYIIDGSLSIDSSHFYTTECWGDVRSFMTDIRKATPEEKHWFNQCIIAKKFVSKEEALKKFSLSTLTKFPEEGYCISLDNNLINYLKNRPDSFSDYVILQQNHTGVAWNKNKYWGIVSNSHRKLYQLQDLQPFFSNYSVKVISSKKIEEKLVKSELTQCEACDICKYTDDCDLAPLTDKDGECPAHDGEYYPKDFILPKYWHVVVTEENLEVLSEWRFPENNWKLEVGQITGISSYENSKAHNPKTSRDTFGQEITFEQFKQYVLKEKEVNPCFEKINTSNKILMGTSGMEEFKKDDFVLPKEWYIKVTNENKEEIYKWRTAGICSVGFYCLSKGHSETYNKNAVGYCVYDKPSGTEITFEQFKKYVLKEDVNFESPDLSPDFSLDEKSCEKVHSKTYEDFYKFLGGSPYSIAKNINKEINETFPSLDIESYSEYPKLITVPSKEYFPTFEDPYLK